MLSQLHMSLKYENHWGVTLDQHDTVHDEGTTNFWTIWNGIRDQKAIFEIVQNYKSATKSNVFQSLQVDATVRQTMYYRRSKAFPG